MDTIAIIEKSIAFVFAFVVGGTTTIQLRNDWHSTGLDNVVTKILLGLMAFGCVLVILATLGILGGG
jgi:peptidase E